MASFFGTVSSKGQIVIPATVRHEFGIESGTRIRFTIDGGRVILDPETLAAKFRKIDQMRGITAGGPSGTDLLLAERRRERALELEKDGF